MGATRWETFSDGVFAIAVTLLILDVRVPHDVPLSTGLLALWPAVAAYIASFLYIGTWWIAHHLIGDHLVKLDGAALMMNLFFLLTIAFIPFPTAVLADHVSSGIDTGLAAALYGASMLLVTILSNIFTSYAISRDLFGKRLARIAPFLRYRWLGTAFYAISIPLALAYPLVAFALFVVSPIFYGALFVRFRFMERIA